MKKKIRIPYCPLMFKVLSTPVLAGIAFYVLVHGHWIWALVFVLSIVMILTTEYVTEIDLHAKHYRDYLRFFVFELNEEKKKFNTLDLIIITKGKYARNISTRYRHAKIRWTEYTGTLLYDIGTLELATTNDKHELLLKLKEFADFLQVDVEDRTTSEPFLIDMERV